MAAEGKNTSSMLPNPSVSASLAASGFDICHEFDAAWYNTHIQDENLKQLEPVPMFGRSSALSLLIGNSRHFWPIFLAWLKTELEKDNQEELVQENPIDSYVHSRLATIIGSHFHDETNYKIFWSDSSFCDQQQQLVSMQHVALVSGLCYHADQIHLSIHPEFGPWIAFRAVVVLDRPFSSSSQQQQRPPIVPCLLSTAEQENSRKALAAALAVSYRVNRCTQLQDWSKDEEVNRAWIALRDCIITGRNYRYSEGQLAYHYTKDAKLLMKELKQQGA
jgi:methylmalonic aciduria homocystinuria type C protein